ncbi:hypothetical protein FACS1894219_07820 [Clostridia bacterium]|nr:hypothetical protein FACS1894219_07820 [Clostridia bacterium]
MQKRLAKAGSIIALSLFLLMILFFTLFGKNIRDYYSPKVTVQSVTPYFITDDKLIMALPCGSVITDELTGESVFFHVEENDLSGEKAFYAVKETGIITGINDGKSVEITGGFYANKQFIYNSDRSFKDGDRVVIVKDED